ncbi:MAG: ribosome maturation factor RimP [Microthrixaceae bacterium]|nr:ribosome maturation factor RimP [Microthrixaceae bacterium]
MSATTERVGALVAPVLERMSLRLYDVDAPGPTLRVMVDRDGGVDIDTLAEATREISRLLDDSEPVAGSYTLEVSSPGLERPLRTPQHFEGAVGEQVRIKLLAGTQGDRRCEGTLVSVAVDAITVETPRGPSCDRSRRCLQGPHGLRLVDVEPCLDDRAPDRIDN